MKSKLIVMLTNHDITVENALDVFRECRDLPVEHWGFKNVGLQRGSMTELIDEMKAVGKKTFLEVVTYTESECLAGAKLAVDMGFDYLMGTVFFPSVWDYLKDKKVKYFPFIGKVWGSPSILEGEIEDIIEQGKELSAAGVDGFDLLAFRYIGGIPEELVKKCISAINIPVVIAGSINSRERMQFIEDIGAWGYTMGSALFESNFVKNGSVRENLDAVVNLMNEIK